MRPFPSKRFLLRLAVLLLLCLAPFVLLLHNASSAEDTDEDTSAQTINLHQWGAVTLFHGLPSDRVRAIAQDSDGVMWFGTDAGLARYDGRRTQTVTEGGLAGRRVFALAFDTDGSLWVGTDAGAFVRASGEYRRVAETEGRAVTSVTVVEAGGDERAAKVDRALGADRGTAAAAPRARALLTAAGAILDCRLRADGSLDVRRIEDRLLTSAGANVRGGAAERPGAGASSNDAEAAPLELTGAALVGDALLVATRGRGFLAVEGGAVREVSSRPRAYFVEALAQDAEGRVWFGAQTTPDESGLYTTNGLPERPSKVLAGATGTVTALRFDPRGDLFVGTDGEGVFRYRGRTRLERFTFAGTRGGLRSDRVYSVFFDREGVAWFGTDRGVCRYDARGLRNELLAEGAQHNFVRALFRTSKGSLLAGTNRGLFVREATSAATARWRAVEGLEGRTVYALAEDASGLLLVGTNAGLYAGLPSTRPPRDASNVEASAESKPGEPKPPAADAAAKQTAGNTGDTKRTADTPPAAAEPKPADETETKAADGAKKAEGDEAKKPAPEASKRASEPALVGNVRAVATFDGATYIASFGRGLERLDRAEGRPRRALVWPSPDDDPRLREVVSLHADSSGRRLWLGTASAGVFFYDGREVRTEPALDPLRGAAVRSISGGAGAPLWLATGRGLYLYRDGALTEAVRGLDARAVIALPHEPTTNVTAAAWCATAGGGLLRVAVDELFGVIVARLDVEQGLPSQSAFALLPSSEDGADALWVGTARGASRYEPGRVAPTLRASRVTGARAHQPEELKSGLRLEYPQNSLVVDVEATSSRTFPEQFQYAFLLYDGKGEIIKRKLAHDSQFQLENLPPGDYRVEARAYTVDLTPSPPLSFALRVPRAPFPWTTAALSVLLGLAFVALAWGAVQNARERRAGRALLDANRKLADARLQLANETEAERRRIARDLHDQTLADLRRLLLLTDQLPAAPNGSNGHDETLDPAALRSEIESISGEVRRICEDLSPSVLENVGFAAALEFALAHAIAHLPADCRFTYEFVCDDDIEERLRFSRGVQLQIYRIVQEAVSNVCRHAGATHVRLRVDVNEAGEFVLTLEDDGRGFDHDNRSARRGRGLSNIRARASIIEAAVRWHKRDARGTVFMLRKGAGENGGTSKSQ